MCLCAGTAGQDRGSDDALSCNAVASRAISVTWHGHICDLCSRQAHRHCGLTLAFMPKGDSNVHFRVNEDKNVFFFPFKLCRLAVIGTYKLFVLHEGVWK